MKEKFNLENRKAIVVEQILWDITGEQILRNKTNANNIEDTARGFKNVIEKAGLPFELKRISPMVSVREKFIKIRERDLEKTKEYLKKGNFRRI